MLAERLPSELDHTNSEGADISESTRRKLLWILQPQEKPCISLDSKDSKHRLQRHWKTDFMGLTTQSYLKLVLYFYMYNLVGLYKANEQILGRLSHWEDSRTTDNIQRIPILPPFPFLSLAFKPNLFWRLSEHWQLAGCGNGYVSDNILFLACSASCCCFGVKRGSFVLGVGTGWSEIPKGLDISLSCPVSTSFLPSGGLWHSNPLFLGLILYARLFILIT